MPEEPLTPAGEIVLYSTEDGRARVECRFSGETVWLTQALMAELYQKDVRTINEHLRNIYEEAELDPHATIRKLRIVRREGARDVARLVDHYNLAAILAVGYRVHSPRGAQFRRWATERLSEYLVKPTAMLARAAFASSSPRQGSSGSFSPPETRRGLAAESGGASRGLRDCSEE